MSVPVAQLLNMNLQIILMVVMIPLVFSASSQSSALFIYILLFLVGTCIIYDMDLSRTMLAVAGDTITNASNNSD